MQLRLQDTAASAEKVRQLESHRRQVSNQLQQARAEMEVGRAELVFQYDEKLRTSNERLQQGHVVVENFRLERDNYQKVMENGKAEYMERKNKFEGGVTWGTQVISGSHGNSGRIE